METANEEILRVAPTLVEFDPARNDFEIIKHKTAALKN